MTAPLRIRALSLALALALPLSAGCSSNDDAPAAVPAAGFEAEPAPADPSLSLAGSAQGSELVIDVAGNGLSDVYGAAFRLSYDPLKLKFIAIEPGSAFSGASDVLHSAKASDSGVLFAVVTRRGKQSAVAANGQSVARLRFQTLGPGESSLSFVASRSGVVRADGSRVAGLSLAGGRVITR